MQRVGDLSLGVVYSDADLVELLRRAGLDEAEALVDGGGPTIEWRGEPHDFGWGPVWPVPRRRLDVSGAAL